MNKLNIHILYAFLAGIHLAFGSLVSDAQDLELVIGHTKTVTVTNTSLLENDVILSYSSNHHGLVNVSIEGDGKSGPPWKVLLTGEHPGHVVISFNLSKNITDVSKAFVRVTVMRSTDLEITSVVVGWLYFAAWSVSFYPQVYENWKRKSVVGLNFDFLSLNLIGFTLYSIFNCGLYWIPSIQEEYFSLHPKGLNPVQLNDIFFSLHAVGITFFTIIQCLIYERGGQTVSWTAHGIIGVYLLIVAVALILSLFTSYFSWLNFINTCSYLKLVTTLIKYIPQAYMNYKRKSTIGWSIGNVVLDFTGGILSMLQMIINADNYDDWASIFGDPTKFGLGFFSVLFDILFLVQHYILYRRSRTNNRGILVPPIIHQNLGEVKNGSTVPLISSSSLV